MPDFVTQEEFGARVGVLEQEVEGEKMVTRHILEQTRHNGDDLAAVKTRLDRVETRLEGVDRKVDALGDDVGKLKRSVGDLVKNLPQIVGEAVRGVLKERDRKA
ncbi:MAG: hypothetical protein ACRED5_22175 [Propylenella sp.]